MSYEDVVLASNPVAWWRLNETSGLVAADSSGNGLNGTYLPNSGGAWTGGTQGVDGATIDGDKAARFNGSRARVEAMVGALGNGDFTVSAWLKTSSLGTFVALSGIGSEGNLWLGTYDGKGAFSVSGGIAQSGHTINDGQWHHVLAVRDGGACRVYVNAVSDDTTFNSSQNIDGAVPFLIGDFGPAGFSWVGSIDEIFIHNYALTQSQITELYTAATTPEEIKRRSLFGSRLFGSQLFGGSR